MILSLFRRKPSAEARLAATMKPDPEYRKRRLAQLPPERRAKCAQIRASMEGAR